MREGHAYLVEMDPHDLDATAQVRDAQGVPLANSNHPERRTGTRRAVVTAAHSGSVTVLITGRERDNRTGTASVRLYDLKSLAGRPACLEVQKQLAAADTSYAQGTALMSAGTGGDGKARDAFARAANGYREVPGALTAPADRGLRGQAELALAGLEYYDLAEWDQTVQWGQAASADLAGDPYLKARADALIAAAWLEIGYSGPSKSSVEALHRARAETQRLAAFHLRRRERYDAALQLTNTGLSYYYEGLYAECEAYASRAAGLFGEIGQIRRRAQSWQNRALCLWGEGHIPEALVWFERARHEIPPEPYPLDYFAVVDNTAHADYALGHFDEALRLFEDTRKLAHNLGLPRYEAESLYGFGVTYYALGSRDLAGAFLESARRLSDPIVDRRQSREILRALATVTAESGQTRQAIRDDGEALALAVTPVARGHIRIQLAAHTAEAEQFAAALSLLDDILAKEAKSEPYLQAEALVARAVVLREMDRPREALADLAAARSHLHMLGSIAVEFKANLEEARAQRQLGKLQAALTAVERAIGESDLIRLQSADPELRSQLQAPLRAAYDLKIELLRTQYDNEAAAGRSEQAQQLAASAFVTADVSRAHTLADVAAQEYSPALRHALAPEFRRRELTYRDLAARRFALDQRLDRSADDPGVQRLRAEIADLEHTVDLINTKIAAAAGRAGGMRGKSAAALPRIPGDSALVAYWLGTGTAYAWVVSDAQLHWVRLLASKEVSEKAFKYHHSLTHFGNEPIDVRLRDSAALSQLIIAPLEAWLEDKKQWIVIPDGALDYVPFVALRVRGGSFVAEQHYIALAPAAWMLQSNVDRPAAPEPRLLLVADPVYQADDPRLPAQDKSGRGAPPAPEELPRKKWLRLPFTAVEAARIAAQFSPSQVDALIGVNATRERVLALDWSRYRYIHIATHGIVDAEVPALSALVLGSYDASGHPVDGAVRVADLSLMKLDAEVAVFSACETAFGKEVPSEGLVGISSTVLARGAHAVIASLWPVSDEMSARLMTEVYQHLLRDSLSAPAALGKAMHSVLEKEPSADPALWAAFQVSVSALGAGAPANHNPH